MIFEPESGRDEEAGVVGLLSLVGMFFNLSTVEDIIETIKIKQNNTGYA